MSNENQIQKDYQNLILKEAIKWNCVYLLGLLVFCCAIILHIQNIIIQILTILFAIISSIFITIMNFGATGIFDEEKS